MHLAIGAGVCRRTDLHEARDAHRPGQVASTLMEKAPELLAGDPSIERLDVLAGKVDVSALAPQPAG